jgi:hypothetical protein
MLPNLERLFVNLYISLYSGAPLFPHFFLLTCLYGMLTGAKIAAPMQPLPNLQ